MCEKCREYVPNEKRRSELEDIITAAYDSGVKQVEASVWQGNDAITTLLRQIHQQAKLGELEAAAQFSRGELDMRSFTEELDQIKSESLILTLWAGAYLGAHPDFDLKTWECDDFMNHELPCGHTNMDHKRIDGLRKNAECN